MAHSHYHSLAMYHSFISGPCCDLLSLCFSHQFCAVILVLTHIFSTSLFAAVPPKVEEAFRLFCYMLYMSLSISARGEEEVILNANSGFSVKSLDHHNEKPISVMDSGCGLGGNVTHKVRAASTQHLHTSDIVLQILWLLCLCLAGTVCWSGLSSQQWFCPNVSWCIDCL